MTEAKKPKPRSGPTTWAKGKSGNPGGRSPKVGPNGETWTQLLRAMTPEAAERIKRLITSPDDEIAIKGLAMWMPYAWGKPAESKNPDEPGKVDMATVLSDLIAKLPA